MKCWGPSPAQANEPHFKVKWGLPLGLKHVIYFHLYCSSKHTHQPSHVVIHMKEQTIHATTILKLQDKRRWAVEETNIGVQEIHIEHLLQEVRSLLQSARPFLGFQKRLLAEATMKFMLKANTVLNQGFTKSSPASANHFKELKSSGN